MTLTKEQLAALGLGPGDARVPRRSLEPRSATGHGFAGVERPLAEVGAATHWLKMFDDLPLGRSQDTPGVHALALAPDDEVHATGMVSKDEDQLLVDARHGLAAVRLSGVSRDLLYLFDKDAVTVEEITPRAVAELERKDLSDEPPLASPAPDALLRGFSAETWLVEAASALARRKDDVARAAAAGLVARLATPPKEDAKATLERLLAGDPSPVERALAWLDALGEAGLDRIEQGILLALAPLEEAFSSLREAVLADDEDAAELGRHWLHERDDLESAAFLLLARRPESPVRQGLDDFDHACAVHHALWSGLQLGHDPRLDAVSWRHPENWWGRLAEG